ncbi:MAG: hypothetical protein WCV59_04320 [Parcubacteria group bacterium]|jgi:hypothetical protein
MSVIIGAETARLAGLQIDLLSKLRKGELSLEELEWFLNLKKEERERNSGIIPVRKNLNLKKFLLWLKKNKLESKLSGGLMGQIAEQEVFYRQFYGDDFRIDFKKISIDPNRMPAIKAGLEAGCLSYAEVKATPLILSDTEAQMTGARFFYERIMKPLKKEGFRVWAENGTDRWTKLTLAELLERGISVEPEEFNSDDFKNAWVAEIIRLIIGKRPLLVIPGMVDLIFTNSAQDISTNQTIVNKDGRIVELRDCSYISAIERKVRVVSAEEEMILACQRYAKNKTYLAPKTWDWLRNVVDHRDKGTNPGVSCGIAGSCGGGFGLGSCGAGSSNSVNRLRLAL